MSLCLNDKEILLQTEINKKMDNLQKSNQRMKVEKWILQVSQHNCQIRLVVEELNNDFHEGKYIEYGDPRTKEIHNNSKKIRFLENRVYKYFGFKKGKKWYCNVYSEMGELFLQFEAQPERLYDIFALRAEALHSAPADTLHTWIKRARTEGLSINDIPSALYSIPAGWWCYVNYLWDIYCADNISTETIIRELEHVQEIRSRFRNEPRFRDSKLNKVVLDKLGLIEFYVSTLPTRNDTYQNMRREQQALFRKYGIEREV
jgi:hypothetical protein